MNHLRSLTALSLLLAFAGTGCQEAPPPTPPKPVAPAAQPMTGELPPGHPPIGQMTAGLPPGHPPIDGMSAQSLPASSLPAAANPQWNVPADWKGGRASSVRRGSWTVAGPDGQSADVAVTVFSGDVGGELANVNRWRGQLGLPPVTAAELAGLTTKLTVNGIAATVVEFQAAAAAAGQVHPAAMLVATLPHEGSSWFVKLQGDAPLVQAQKENFLAFVRSVKFGDACCPALHAK